MNRLSVNRNPIRADRAMKVLTHVSHCKIMHRSKPLAVTNGVGLKEKAEKLEKLGYEILVPWQPANMTGSYVCWVRKRIVLNFGD
ncbi:hypothetical protein GPX89_40300 [Nocardia sp. ET3-3]|uniref:Uncharacterized protein n=1 Tax=Nocardia terrae TaxID=2675851 RepID=A0A7K1VA80_9NOCA|nr:hypothetical protein [Nocardia terrae]MVU83467.1 hypothetical protein [Nocardia terrae]